MLSKEHFDQMVNLADKTMVANYFTNLQNDDITLLTKYDEDYPEKLRGFYDAPFFLFCKGDISLLNNPSIAVVGTRKPSSYGKMVTSLRTDLIVLLIEKHLRLEVKRLQFWALDLIKYIQQIMQVLQEKLLKRGFW